MAHEFDKLGNPLDPELNEWENQICNLAAEWRSAKQRGLDIDKLDKIVADYHEVLKKMYEKGWRSSLDIECELPDEFLPDFYLNSFNS